MAVIALTDAFVYLGAHDFTGDSNKGTLTSDVEAVKVSTFASGGWDEFIGGVKSGALDLAGFWQSAADSVDVESFTNLGTANRVLTIGDIETEATACYLSRCIQAHYTLGGTHGEAMPFSLTGSGSDGNGVVRGQLAKAKGDVSATGALGSVVNLGAPSATQYVYASFHVFTAGTTITVTVESDTAANFPSATTRGTIGPLTTTGGTWLTRVAGPFAGETHWRFNVTAITGTFNVAGAIAVQ